MTQMRPYPRQTTPLTESYQMELIEGLKDQLEAAAYLEAALDPQESDVLPIVLSNLSQAQSIQQEEQLKVLSDDRNLAVITTLLSTIQELGFQISITPKNYDRTSD